MPRRSTSYSSSQSSVGERRGQRYSRSRSNSSRTISPQIIRRNDRDRDYDRRDNRRDNADRGGRYGRSRSPAYSGGQDEDEGYRLHVSDLTADVSKRELEETFNKYGSIKEVWVARNPPCFAFIVFKREDDAMKAMKKVDNTYIGDNKVRVTIARPRTRGMRRGNLFDPNMRCYSCGQRGHFSRECQNFGRRSFRSSSRSRSRDRRRQSPVRRSRSRGEGRRRDYRGDISPDYEAEKRRAEKRKAEAKRGDSTEKRSENKKRHLDEAKKKSSSTRKRHSSAESSSDSDINDREHKKLGPTTTKKSSSKLVDANYSKAIADEKHSVVPVKSALRSPSRSRSKSPLTHCHFDENSAVNVNPNTTMLEDETADEPGPNVNQFHPSNENDVGKVRMESNDHRSRSKSPAKTNTGDISPNDHSPKSESKGRQGRSQSPSRSVTPEEENVQKAHLMEADDAYPNPETGSSSTLTTITTNGYQEHTVVAEDAVNIEGNSANISENISLSAIKISQTSAFVEEKHAIITPSELASGDN